MTNIRKTAISIPVTIALEHRFLSDKTGKVFTNATFDYEFWQRYLEIFDDVRVIARVRQVEDIPENFLRSDGDRVSFVHVPCYIGPKEFVLNSPRVICTIFRNVDQNSAYILRMPGTLGSIVWLKLAVMNILRRKKLPYALEVVGDPYDVFSPGSVRYPIRPLFRLLFGVILKRQCRNAVAASYVTREALQKRYPCKGRMFFYSSINLRDEEYADRPREYNNSKDNTFRSIYVGTLEQLYKGPDVLLDAIRICKHKGHDLILTIVGDGKHRNELEDKARKLRIKDSIEFTGHISERDRLFQYLDDSDLFILPSRTEGLPRAMIEAMARGLPCIGTTVGGIPELLPEEDLVPPDDPDALAKKIIEVITDPERMTRMSERNLKKAREFSDDILSKRRREFYKYIRDKMMA